MFKSRGNFEGTVSPVVAVALIAATIIIVTGIGLVVGYKFFWNAYDKDTLVEHDFKVAKGMVNRAPKDINARISLGQAYINLGEIDEALNQYNLALQISPGNLIVRYNIALVKVRKQDLAGARQDLEAIKADNPKYWDARETLGILLFQQHEYKLAVQELQVVNAFEPGKISVLYTLSQAYKETGQKDKAKATLEQALKYDPQNEQLRKALADLQ